MARQPVRRASAVPDAAGALTGRLAASAVTSVRVLPGGVAVRTGDLWITVTAPRHDILRVRVTAAEDAAETLSWAVNDAVRHAAAPTSPLDEPDAAGFATATLEARIMRGTGALVVTDRQGRTVCADAEGWPAELRQGGFSIAKRALPEEHIFGLGDQPGPLDRSGQSFVLWNTDAGWYQDSSTPLYKSIPFFIAARSEGCCGILLDNTWRSHFDFGRARRGVTAFGAEDGPADYYIMAGRGVGEVLQAYAHLTGLPPMPPLWAFGFQQSRYSYLTQDAVLEVAEGLRSRSIPADVIYCDIDYQDRYRPFTVDRKAFPDFPGMVATLQARGLRTVAITDLHIAKTEDPYPPYETGLAGGHFIHNPDGTPYIGRSWPGDALFPDFTRPATRAWWGTLYERFVADGVAGFWNDMNEPAVANGPGGTMPLDIVHRVEEPGYPARDAPHAEIHNVLGMQNLRATYEALLALRPGERPFVLTRASFAGGQRYGWTWTGDNSATWAHLRLTTPMLANAGLSGLAFIGADVGGFFGSPPPDLLTRWFQVAAFHPLFRNHAFTESAAREPWLDGPEHGAIRRRAIEERYRLLPYIYTVAEEAVRTGLPMLRPLFLEHPAMLDAERWYLRDWQTQFLLGPALMVAPPPFGEMVDGYTVTLPDGVWYDYWTGRRIEAAAVAVKPTLAELPVFVRGGTILPRQGLVQSTAETPSGPLELAVYPDASGAAGTLYADDGLTDAHAAGHSLRLASVCEGGPEGLTIRLAARDGDYVPWWTTIELVVHGIAPAQAHVTVEHAKLLAVQHDGTRQALRVLLAEPGGAWSVSIGPAAE